MSFKSSRFSLLASRWVVVCAALLLSLLVAPSVGLGAAVVDRDEFSTTVDVGGGKLRTSLSSEPLNYQMDSGVWRPIDTDLAPEFDGDLHPASVDGDVAIPGSLSQPIELEHDGHLASFRLVGAGGDVDAEGSEASFAHALALVDVSYVARAYGVKETLELQSSLSPRSFAYDLRGGAAWSAAVESGDVVLRDGGGVERYRVSAPLAWDSAPDPAFTNALNLSVSKVSAGRWRVTLRPDAAWLGDPARRFPVSIDPDFSWSGGTTRFHGAQDCYLSGGAQAIYTFCAQTYLQTGYYNRPYRSIFKFDIASAIPSNATVSAAQFRAYQPPQTQHIAMGHKLQTITSDWDAAATWNNRKTGTPWTTPGGGGDVSTAANFTSASTTVQAYNAWYSWNAPLAAVQGWVNGSLPNYGFMLSTVNTANIGNAYVWASTEASPTSQFPADSTKWPTLDVTWTQPAAVDTTAPPTPEDLALDPFDPVDGTAVLSFQVAPDVGPSGQPISGLGGTQVRFSSNGGSLSDWESTAGNEYPIGGSAVGDSVHVEVRSLDMTGNASTAAAATFTVASEDAQPEVDPIEASEFASAYGVSVSNATIWLTAQTTTGDLLLQLTKSTVAADVAGAWFDNTAQRIHLQVTDSNAAPTVTSYAADAGVGSFAQVDTVAASADQIRDNYSTAARQLSNEIAANKIRPFSDLKSNQLLLFVDSAASAAVQQHASSVAQALTPPATVMSDAPASRTTEYQADYGTCSPVSEKPLTNFDVSNTYCTKAMRGGMALLDRTNVLANSIPADRKARIGLLCSSAFNAEQDSDHAPQLLTAGHCADSVNPNTGEPFAGHTNTWTGMGYGIFGTMGQWRFGNNTAAGPNTATPVENSYYDAAAIKYDTANLNKVYPLAYLGVGTRYNGHKVNQRFKIKGVVGDAGLKPGQWVCLLGGRTGAHCGNVIGYKNASSQAFEYTGCGAYGGDSGSAVVAGHLAAGIHSAAGFRDVASSENDFYSWLNKPRSQGGFADTGDPFILGCEFFQTLARRWQVNTAMSISDASAITGTHVLTGTWRKPGTKSALDTYVRAELTWDTKANLDLHLWDEAGHHTSHVAGQETAIPASSLKLDLMKGPGPETFVETASSSERQYDVGVCYRDNGALAHRVPTRATLKLTSRDGTVETKSVRLNSPGAGALLRTDESSAVPHTDWCDPPSSAPDGIDDDSAIDCDPGWVYIQGAGCLLIV